MHFREVKLLDGVEITKKRKYSLKFDTANAPLSISTYIATCFWKSYSKTKNKYMRSNKRTE